jgi:hypothetical protein
MPGDTPETSYIMVATMIISGRVIVGISVAVGSSAG